jgi:hypothetical protein
MKKLFLILFMLPVTVFYVAGVSNITDGFGLMLQAPFSGPTSLHLTGEPAVGDDMIDGLGSTVAIFFPFSRVAGYTAKGTQIAVRGGIKAIETGSYTFTKTAARHLATRPYMNSPSTIANIIKSGKGVPDAFYKGGMNYKVQGTFNGSNGIFELGINPETNTIYHFLFKTIK